VFPHDFAGAIAIFKKGRIRDFAFELFETLAFTLNEKIKVHSCCSGGCVQPLAQALAAASTSTFS